MKTYYKAGVWNATCDVCGFAHKSDELKLRWDGLMVCAKDFESRHPQDLLRVPRELGSVPWVRNTPTDNFQTTNISSEASEDLLTESGDHLVW